MVRAWYINDDQSDQRNEHHKNPSEFISVEDLFKLSGVEYFKINVETMDTDGKLQNLKKEHGCTYEDEIVCSRECLSTYEDKFHQEHLHRDEEIRLIVDGSGYFDVRDKNDQWIRIECMPGDLLVLPSGIYHRLTLENKNFIKVRRFFIDEPVWVGHNRPADNMECRQNYVNSFQNGTFVKVQQ